MVAAVVAVVVDASQATGVLERHCGEVGNNSQDDEVKRLVNHDAYHGDIGLVREAHPDTDNIGSVNNPVADEE